jgi:hypothetical protein
MTVRFNCGACRAVLKVPEVVTVERKVRCTSCGVVILLTPDETSPIGMTVTLPDTSGKEKHKKKAEVAQQRRVLWVVLAVLVVLLAGGLWWTLGGPSNRAAVEGEVKLDKVLMEKGTIIFIAVDDPKKTAKGTIEKGRYKLSASEGPYVGRNKVEIYSPRGTGKEIEKPGGRPGEMMEATVEGVAAEYNTQTRLSADIKATLNVENFEVKSK